MKNISQGILLVSLFLFFACGQQKEKGSSAVTQIDSTKLIEASKPKKLTKEEKRKQQEIQERADSLRMDEVLEVALRLAEANVDSLSYSVEFDSPLDSLYIISTKMKMGHFFSKEKKHLIIYRNKPIDLHINIYVWKEHTFQEILAYSRWNREIVLDTIQDINNDGELDFLVKWRGQNGCCLKNFSDVFLYQSEKEYFFPEKVFINPTFSFKEKIIRGVRYGHPGETEMYKFKWKGFAVDTIEYVYFEKDKKGKSTGTIIKSRALDYQDGPHPKIRLKRVPKEYRNIYGYYWFMGRIE